MCNKINLNKNSFYDILVTDYHKNIQLDKKKPLCRWKEHVMYKSEESIITFGNGALSINRMKNWTTPLRIFLSIETKYRYLM